MQVEATISWTAVAALSVFILTQLTNFGTSIMKIRRDKRHLILAIHAELSQVVAQSGEASNTKRFNDFVDSCSIDKINAYAIPLYNSRLYDSFAEKLPLLPSEVVGNIVEAYGLLNRMNGLINHFKTKEF